jgi:hypothetical protein
VDAVKNIPSTLKTWRKPVWNEDGDSHHDSTYRYSEMPGELDKKLKELPRGIKSEEEFERIRRNM